jgi:O-antigen/teichoic acid export membrane protein
MSVAKKLLQNTALSFGAKMLSAVLGIISVGILTRSLGTEGFGEYSLILAYLYIFSLFADFGLYSLLLREISKPNSDESKIFTHIFLLRLFLIFVFFGLAFLFIGFFPYSQNVKNNLLWGALLYSFISLNQVITTVFQKQLKMFAVAFAEVLARCIQLAVFVYLYIEKNFDLSNFLMAAALASGVNFVVLFFARKKYIKFSMKLEKSYFGELVKEAWPLGASILFVFIYFKMDSIILSVIKGVEAVGVYSAAYKIFENLIVFPAMFVGLVTPILTNTFYGDKEHFKKIFQSSQDALVWAAVPVVFGGVALASPIIKLIGGKSFLPAAEPFVFLMLSLLFVFAASLYGSMVIVLRRQKIATLVYATGAVFNFFANIYFIKKYSYVGASITTLGTEVLVTTLLFMLVVKYSKFRPDFRRYGRVLAAGAIMGLSVWSFPVQNIVLKVILGGAIYAVLMIVFGVISREKTKLIIRDIFKKEQIAQ